MRGRIRADRRAERAKKGGAVRRRKRNIMEENQNGFQPEQSEQDVNAIPEQDAEENAQPAEVEAPEAETAEQSTQEASEETAQPTAAPEKQPKKKAALGIALAAVVAVLAVAAIFITQAIKNKNVPDEIDPGFSQSADAETPAQDPEQTSEETPEETPAETKPITGVIAHRNAQGYASYTMTAEQATDEVLDLVVANCGDWALDNRGLAYYYWEQYYSFASQYGQYLSYLMDTSLGLDEQLYNDTDTWQETFLNAAIQRFGMVSAICQEAEANGYTLDADSEEQLTAIRENLESSAANYGYDDADRIVQDAFGANTTLDAYMEFVRKSMVASGYLNAKLEQIECTDEQLSDYYDEHADDYLAQGIEKDDTHMINVRHILITPSEQDENGEYTEEAWAAAEEEAQRILAEWESGEKTEESFAELAMQYSTDPGSNTNGGLYEDVYPGMMVTEFNDWCFAEDRNVADYGIVKTSYGYHIMYMSGVSDELYWKSVVKEAYLNEQASALLDEICARYPVTSDLSNAGILELKSSASENAAE